MNDSSSVSLVYDTRRRTFRGDAVERLPLRVRERVSSLVAGAFGIPVALASEDVPRREALALELATRGRAVLEVAVAGDGYETPSRVELSIVVSGGNEVLVRARDVSARAASMSDLGTAVERVSAVADLWNCGVAVFDASGRCLFANATLLGMCAQDEMEFPVSAEQISEAVSAPTLAAQLAKRQLGLMTPYQARVQAGGTTVDVVISPLPIFGADGTYLGSVCTITENAGAGQTDVLRRYRDEMQAMMQTGGQILAQMDEMVRADRAGAGRRSPRASEAGPNGAGATRETPLDLMTPRERDIATRLATGMRVTEIASNLGISVSTARNHLKSIFRKLNVTSQIALVSLLSR